MAQNGDSFFGVAVKIPLKMAYTAPDLFEYACQHELLDYNSGRYLIDHLTYADNNNSEYPSYIQFPVVFHTYEGSKLCDILSMRYVGISGLFSDRIIQLLKDNNITGWKTYPIILFDRNGNVIKGYNGFSVTGRAGKIHELVPESEIIYEERNRYRQWERASWDGSDFAHIEGRFKTICTNKVKDVFMKAKIKGLKFTPFEEEVTII